MTRNSSFFRFQSLSRLVMGICLIHVCTKAAPVKVSFLPDKTSLADTLVVLREVACYLHPNFLKKT
jgi:hypothetical protein